MIAEKGQRRHKEILPFCDGIHEGREQFKLLFKMYFHKTGVALAKHVTFIGDGAPWIWNIVDEIIKELNIDPQKVTRVLDYYHAYENFWKVIDALPKLTQKEKQRLKIRQILHPRNSFGAGILPVNFARDKKSCLSFLFISSFP